ncbi:real-time isoform X3 [Anticarsia gemmatalis]|uniref:real-time isoform X3 n=1 Tax=Anticarsia gemmatalis TaxID=129554 RepID=UPI003F760468
MDPDQEVRDPAPAAQCSPTAKTGSPGSSRRTPEEPTRPTSPRVNPETAAPRANPAAGPRGRASTRSRAAPRPAPPRVSAAQRDHKVPPRLAALRSRRPTVAGRPAPSSRTLSDSDTSVSAASEVSAVRARDTEDDAPRDDARESPAAPDSEMSSRACSSTSLDSAASGNPDQYTLDSEYIKRYLGELTPMQESRLLQLRKWIADLQKGKVPSDTTLLRFLRARDFNVEKAREMLSQSLLWRKKHQVDRILSEYETPDVVKQYFPGGWHHHDKDGRPLYILRLGQMDVKGLLKSIGEDGLLKLTLHVCEEGLKLLEEATRSSEHAIQSWCLLVDLDGLNMRHLWRPGVRALLRIIQIVEANYPETMGRVLIVRAPRVFPILWTIVSTFIDENTRSKFLFYGGKDYLQPGGLLDYIPKDLIPDFLGGPCKSFVHEGGLVPKSLYVSGAFTERDGDPLCEDSIYRSVSLGKGQVHEVIVVNRDPQSVLTWDFDVLRHDIAFTVYRSEHELRHPPPDATALCVGGGEEQKSVLEQKGWREGEHFHRVENTLVCHDGESIQGSHVMLECGSYVLQWRCELLDSTHRAAQLMYFHETLASHHYKGSMSSLQSGTSGFSCLSGKSAASSCPSR